jgi:hypothetical protein
LTQPQDIRPEEGNVRIERQQNLQFWKWDTKGQSLDVVITEAPVYGRPNSFGGTDNFFRGVISGTEDKVQVNMPYDLREKVKTIEESIEYGTTRLVITFTGTKPMKGKAPLKLFDVDAEGLKE